MKTNHCQSINFGATINIRYSKKSTQLRDAVKQAERYLRKIGGNDISHDIFAKKDFLDIETIKHYEDNSSYSIGHIIIKGKKAADKSFLMRRLRANKNFPWL